MLILAISENDMDKVIMIGRAHLLQGIAEFEHKLATLNEGVPHGGASIWTDSSHDGGDVGALGRLEAT